MIKNKTKVTRVKRILSKLSYSELVELNSYIEKRRKVVFEVDRRKKADEAWQEFLKLDVEPGYLIWNSSSGMSLYHTWQRGDCGAVWCIQPRLRKIWVETESGWVVIKPADLVTRVTFSMPDVEPVSEKERALAEKMGKIVSESFKI
jgi:hypothetical protein